MVCNAFTLSLSVSICASFWASSRFILFSPWKSRGVSSSFCSFSRARVTDNSFLSFFQATSVTNRVMFYVYIPEASPLSSQTVASSTASTLKCTSAWRRANKFSDGTILSYAII